MDWYLQSFYRQKKIFSWQITIHLINVSVKKKRTKLYLYLPTSLSHLQFEEQQAFERSRRFLRQLEISFGENPSHYQKIVRALQSGSPLSPAGVEEVWIDGLMTKLKVFLQSERGCFFFSARMH